MESRPKFKRSGLAAQVSPFDRLGSGQIPAYQATAGVALPVAEQKAPQSPPVAFSVPEFCSAHRISKALFYILVRDGRGPRIFKVGRRTLISHKAAYDWRCKMEAASAK